MNDDDIRRGKGKTFNDLRDFRRERERERERNDHDRMGGGRWHYVNSWIIITSHDRHEFQKVHCRVATAVEGMEKERLKLGRQDKWIQFFLNHHLLNLNGRTEQLFWKSDSETRVKDEDHFHPPSSMIQPEDGWWHLPMTHVSRQDAIRMKWNASLFRYSPNIIMDERGDQNFFIPWFKWNWETFPSCFQGWGGEDDHDEEESEFILS